MIVFFDLNYECEFAVYSKVRYVDPELRGNRYYLTESDLREADVEPLWREEALSAIEVARQEGTALPSTLFWTAHVCAAALDTAALQNPVIASPRWEPGHWTELEGMGFDDALPLIRKEIERRGIDPLNMACQWGISPDVLLRTMVAVLVDVMVAPAKREC